MESNFGFPLLYEHLAEALEIPAIWSGGRRGEGRGHINMFDLPKWHELTEHVTNPCQEIYIQLVVPG